MASSDEEWTRHCLSDSSDDEWVCAQVPADGQGAFSALAQPVAQTRCPACNGDQVMIGRNQHGSWKKCRMPQCKNKWGYVRYIDQPVTAKHATTSISTSFEVTRHWRRIVLWLMIRAHQEFWDGVIRRKVQRAAQATRGVTNGRSGRHLGKD